MLKRLITNLSEQDLCCVGFQPKSAGHKPRRIELYNHNSVKFITDYLKTTFVGTHVHLSKTNVVDLCLLCSWGFIWVILVGFFLGWLVPGTTIRSQPQF